MDAFKTCQPFGTNSSGDELEGQARHDHEPTPLEMS
jgi:hypothetical protein